MRTLLALAIFFISVSLAVHADPNPEKLELARQLTKLLHVDRMFDGYLKTCERAKESTDDALEAYRNHPESFGGLSPDSPYWKEVETIYSQYRADTCRYFTTDSLMDFFSNQFANRSSIDDLQTAIRFYSTPSGQRLQDMAVEADQAYQEQAMALMRKSSTEAEEKYQTKILALIKKFQSDPTASFKSLRP
jgi:hypothetical protein